MVVAVEFSVKRCSDVLMLSILGIHAAALHLSACGVHRRIPVFLL